MVKANDTWKGEARKIRRKVLTAIASRIARGCVSELGRAARRHHIGGKDPAVAMYASAMGWSYDRAAATVERHKAHLDACNQPFTMDKRRIAAYAITSERREPRDHDAPEITLFAAE